MGSCSFESSSYPYLNPPIQWELINTKGGVTGATFVQKKQQTQVWCRWNCMITSSLGNNSPNSKAGNTTSPGARRQGVTGTSTPAIESTVVTLLEPGNRTLSPLEAKTSFPYFLPSLKTKGGHAGHVISWVTPPFQFSQSTFSSCNPAVGNQGTPSSERDLHILSWCSPEFSVTESNMIISTGHFYFSGLHGLISQIWEKQNKSHMFLLGAHILLGSYGCRDGSTHTLRTTPKLR